MLTQDEIEHQKKANHIVNTVLEKLDKNKDGKISMDEFLAVGLDGLPNFDNLGAEGHHYDVESGALPILRCCLTPDAVFTPRVFPASRR